MNFSIYSDIANNLRLQTEQISDWFIVILYAVCLPIAALNFLFLLSSARFWKKMRNRAKSISDVNNYKKATCHYVKYSLSAVVILLEILIILLFAFVLLLTYVSSLLPRDHIYYYITEMIVDHMTSLGLSILLIPLCAINMLCRFLTTVLVRSELDMEVLTRMPWKCFWKCIISFTLSSTGFEVIKIFGDLLTTILLISECFYLLKGTKRLYRALKSKRIDYFYHRKHKNFFQNQISSFKWGSLAIITLSLFIISNGCLSFYESVMHIFITGFKYRNQDFTVISHGYYELIHFPCFFLSRISLTMWAFVSTLLNVILAIGFVRNALRFRRFISRSFRYKPEFLRYHVNLYRVYN